MGKRSDGVSNSNTSPADPVSNNRMGVLNLDSNSTKACLHMPQGAMGSEVSTVSL